MKTLLLKVISYVALAGTIIPSLFVFTGIMDLQTNKTIMGICMVVWFLSAPFWINAKSSEEVVK